MFENLAFDTTCRSTRTVSRAASREPITCLVNTKVSDKYPSCMLSLLTSALTLTPVPLLHGGSQDCKNQVPSMSGILCEYGKPRIYKNVLRVMITESRVVSRICATFWVVERVEFRVRNRKSYEISVRSGGVIGARLTHVSVAGYCRACKSARRPGLALMTLSKFRLNLRVNVCQTFQLELEVVSDNIIMQ